MRANKSRLTVIGGAGKKQKTSSDYLHMWWKLTLGRSYARINKRMTHILQDEEAQNSRSSGFLMRADCSPPSAALKDAHKQALITGPVCRLGIEGFDPAARAHERGLDLKQLQWVRSPELRPSRNTAARAARRNAHLSENLLSTIKTPMEAWKALSSISLCAVSLSLSTEP